MPSSPIILLDTPIVAGTFAVSKIGPHVEAEKQVWRKAIHALASIVSSTSLIRVPTPVCYELMSMNREWFDYIANSRSQVFRFASSSIPNAIWKKAAEYYFTAMSINTDGRGEKMKTMDPLIAAYSLTGGHYLLTTNQHDFPESHFSVAGTKILTLTGKNGKYRTIIYLLKPREIGSISSVSAEPPFQQSTHLARSCRTSVSTSLTCCCSPVAIFLSTICPCATSVSPTITTHGICF